MAEYLFRGKSTSGEWVYGHYVQLNSLDFSTLTEGNIQHYITYNSDERFLVRRDSVGLWSGLRDKFCGMVFEGDIIEYNQYNETFVGVVRFGLYNTTDGNKYIGFYVDWGKWPHTEYIRNDLLFWIEEDKAVVIGNVTDNPELLEVKDNG